MKQENKQSSSDQKLLIKVCGMREPDNIQAVLELGPELMGMIFYPASKRFVGDEPSVLGKSSILGEPFSTHRSGTLKTGVFVDAEEEYILSKVNNFHLDAVQLHGYESVEYCMQLQNMLEETWGSSSPKPTFCPGSKSKIILIKAFGIDSHFDWATLIEYAECIDYFLFDTRTPDFGGSGKKFDWTLLDQYKWEFPYFISGGIGEEDIPHILELARKDSRLVGIDLNSKYEIQPGYKSINKLKETFKFLRDER